MGDKICRDGHYIDINRVDPLDEDERSKLRKGKVFTPDMESVMQTPESIALEDITDDVSVKDYLSLDSRPLWGGKFFIMVSLITISAVVISDLIDLVISMWVRHWSLGGVFFLLVTVLLFSAIAVLISWFRNRDTLKSVQRFQRACVKIRLKENNCIGELQPSLEQLGKFYAGKPHAVAFELSLNAAPDYLNDMEMIGFLDLNFLQPIDGEAKRIVNKASLQSGLGVGLSQWAAIDALFTFWRNLKMVDMVAKLYGIRPGFKSRLYIMLYVMGNVSVSYSSQIAADYVSRVVSSGVTPKIVAGMVQGVSIALLTQRIGMFAIQACRPVPQSSDDEGKLDEDMSRMLKKILRALRRDNDDGIKADG